MFRSEPSRNRKMSHTPLGPLAFRTRIFGCGGILYTVDVDVRGPPPPTRDRRDGLPLIYESQTSQQWQSLSKSVATLFPTLTIEFELNLCERATWFPFSTKRCAPAAKFVSNGIEELSLFILFQDELSMNCHR